MRKRERLQWNNNNCPFSDSQAQEDNPEKSTLVRWPGSPRDCYLTSRTPTWRKMAAPARHSLLAWVCSTFRWIMNWQKGEWENLDSKYNSNFYSFSDEWTNPYESSGMFGGKVRTWAAPNGAVSFSDFKRDPGRGCYNSWSELRDTAGLVSAWVTSQLPASNFEMPAHRKQNMWYLIVISEPSMMERSDSAVVSFFWLWQNDVIMMFIISFISYFIIVIIKPIFFGTDRIRRSFSGRKK